MLSNQLKDRLSELKLKGMLTAYTQQTENLSVLDLPFEERFGLLLDAEWLHRQNRQLTCHLKNAKFRQIACIEDIDFHFQRDLDRHLIHTLALCEWVSKCQNILISGPTGVGKSFLSCALGNSACRHGFTTRYFRISKLLEELLMSRGDGTFRKLYHSLVKFQLLILDDWGLKPLSSNECLELLELLEDRFDSGATIICSQLPLANWNNVLTDPTIADAILDRLVHNAYKINLKGDSMRKFKSNIPSDAPSD